MALILNPGLPEYKAWPTSNTGKLPRKLQSQQYSSLLSSEMGVPEDDQHRSKRVVINVNVYDIVKTVVPTETPLLLSV